MASPEMVRSVTFGIICARQALHDFEACLKGITPKVVDQCYEENGSLYASAANSDVQDKEKRRKEEEEEAKRKEEEAKRKEEEAKRKEEAGAKRRVAGKQSMEQAKNSKASSSTKRTRKCMNICDDTMR
uniref:Protein MNN4-like n=1 Tax=Macrostomum lignano TaxID=282301 RepID=A0A1I8IEQ5_9PLAT